MIKNHFLKAKINLFKLEKDFIELKDTELKDRNIRIKNEIEELFTMPIIVNIDDMDRFEEEMKKIRPVKNTWFNWLIIFLNL